jgi:hypothetical protein
VHFFLTIGLLVAAIWKGDWRNWRKYSLTIAYVTISNLLYNLICYDYHLWEYKADFLPKKHLIIDLFYTFINLPAVTLIFLTHYPLKTRALKQLTYISYWVIGSLIIEFPFLKWERLVLKNGYEYWMDIFFYILMYGLIRLHFTRPFLTYGFSVIYIIFMIWFFDVPIK